MSKRVMEHFVIKGEYPSGYIVKSEQFVVRDDPAAAAEYVLALLRRGSCIVTVKIEAAAEDLEPEICDDCPTPNDADCPRCLKVRS